MDKTYLVHKQEEMPVASVQMGYNSSAIQSLNLADPTGAYLQYPAHIYGRSGCCTSGRIRGTAAGTTYAQCRGSSEGKVHLREEIMKA